MEPVGYFIIVLFVVMLISITTEHANDTAAALLAFAVAAAAAYLVEGHSFTTIVKTMAWDIILFLTAMMIIVAVVSSSGLFQWSAVVIATTAQGDARKIFYYFMMLTFIISLFFSPMPTMMIVSTFTVEVCNSLDVDFRPYLMTEAVTAGVSSFALPIGSVPNLVIVYFAEMDIGLLFVTMFPLSVILFGVTLWYMLRKFGDAIMTTRQRNLAVLLGIDPETMIRSKSGFLISCGGLVALVLGLILLPQDAPLVSLLIAGVLLVTSKDESHDLLKRLSWESVFFLVGIMGIIQTMIVTGVIGLLSDALLGIAQTNLFLAIAVMLWLPGALLSPLDKKAVGILTAPVAKELGGVNPVLPISLVAGTNIGGYCVPFGDSPNMVAVTSAEEKGKPLTWNEFNKTVIPVGLLHLLIATVYFLLLSMLFV
ncbi:MAG: SLC13 family permease [Candidatus Thorarchaeota archaeon]